MKEKYQKKWVLCLFLYFLYKKKKNGKFLHFFNKNFFFQKKINYSLDFIDWRLVFEVFPRVFYHRRGNESVGVEKFRLIEMRSFLKFVVVFGYLSILVTPSLVLLVGEIWGFGVFSLWIVEFHLNFLLFLMRKYKKIRKNAKI